MFGQRTFGLLDVRTKDYQMFGERTIFWTFGQRTIRYSDFGTAPFKFSEERLLVFADKKEPSKKRLWCYVAIVFLNAIICF